MTSRGAAPIARRRQAFHPLLTSSPTDAFASAKGLPIPERMSDEFEDPDDERAVDFLHTFIDGLTLQASMFPDRLDPQDVSIGLDRFLSALLADPAET
ncbi:TetR family transcriptional regulator C-terminal domain-containing protein [Plantibacter sp. VKM Ac-2885]|uniref:TetR family transcriptional regulator C-terminal domain-containing protein n=1 Tax=Plantibacter sp. VKM Ac-2885 TaxID=2783828 RepID=UPI00188D4260|nr:TetR family transcriptional regulator C-terminal domain-containing protein [Plantibacter sp. VKM Ac-2885]MBF4514188.1 TetR family transcriptional regulator C-terminal domain-containing protein [Plantibacter sp. VKM Ac-2885]